MYIDIVKNIKYKGIYSIISNNTSLNIKNNYLSSNLPIFEKNIALFLNSKVNMNNNQNNNDMFNINVSNNSRINIQDYNTTKYTSKIYNNSIINFPSSYSEKNTSITNVSSYITNGRI